MLRHLDKVVAEWRKHHGTPGLVLAVTDAHGPIGISASGVRELSTRERVTDQTLFEIGSVSKVFTAIAVQQLVERGQLELDASILDVLPWARFESDYDPFTIKHLLTHTAGLPSGRADVPSSWYRAYDIGRLYGNAAPGTHFSYSDYGYHLLTTVVETISRRTFPDYIRENIFQPLGMHDSEPALLNHMRERLACAYEGVHDDRPYVLAHKLLAGPWFEHTEGDGCIASTAQDMSAFARMLLNHGTTDDGHSILSPRSLEDFRTPFAPVDDDTYSGHGIQIRENEKFTALEHEGVIPGFRAYLGVVLASGVGVVVLQNGPGDPATLGRYALELAIAHLNAGDPPDEPEPRIFHAPDDKIRYEGIYRDERGTELRIDRHADGLLIRNEDGEAIDLIQTTDHVFFTDHPRVGVFPLRFHCKNEEAYKITHGPATYARAGARIEAHARPDDWLAYSGHYRGMSTLLTNFRVLIRAGDLLMVTPDGEEKRLVQIEGRIYRVGDDARVPEWLAFGDVIDGQVLDVSLAGSAYYRTSLHAADVAAERTVQPELSIRTKGATHEERRASA